MSGIIRKSSVKSLLALLMAGVLSVQGVTPALAADGERRLINDLQSYGGSKTTETVETTETRDWGDDIAFIAEQRWRL